MDYMMGMLYKKAVTLPEEKKTAEVKDAVCPSRIISKDHGFSIS
jgi:hypothetical protein